jgi:Double zinc ribbon/Bacterial SH3 domain
MVMIRCPECGQRVLDVASSCPQCHRVLIQNPLETHDWARLIECGRCRKHIDRSSTVCPYCGHPVRAVRLAGRTVAGVIGAAALIAGGIILWRTGVVADLTQSLTRAPAAPAPATQPGPPIATRPRDTAKATIAVTESTANPARLPEQERSTTPASVAPSVPTPPPPAQPIAAADALPRLVTRWTVDWANVRQDRSIESPAVQVLPPGREIRVADQRQGWWAVYADSRPIGYIANSVLTTTPPAEPG